MTKYECTLNVERLLNRIRKEEGFAQKAFWDKAEGASVGQYTNGYGTKALHENEIIDREIAEKRMQAKLDEIIKNLLKLFSNNISKINSVRFEVFINLSYNIGFNGVKNFKKMMAELNKENIDWKMVAFHFGDSQYLKQNTNRAIRMLIELSTGENFYNE